MQCAWDVIVVGARTAGSPLAMRLAQRGFRVLVVDRAKFPSDTVSTHMIWPPGVAALHRWGVWPQVAAAGAATIRTGLSDLPGGRLVGPWHAVGDVDYTVSLRRFKLDAILVDAARAAGAELREQVSVESLLWDEGRVCGIVARDGRSGQRCEERAKVVVGADGKRSQIAKWVEAAESGVVQSLTGNFYRYVEGLQIDRQTAEIYTRPDCEMLLVPTDDELTLVNLVVPRSQLDQMHGDVEQTFQAAFDRVENVGERVRGARNVSKIFRATDLPNFYRKAYGPGWALVGDASHCRDPIRSQGIHQAFIDAESLAEALEDHLSGLAPYEHALGAHERCRNLRTRHPYHLCLEAARFHLPPAETTRRFVHAIQQDLQAVAEYRGLIAGSTDVTAFSRRMRTLMSSATNGEAKASA